jgi:hypothetical protein
MKAENIIIAVIIPSLEEFSENFPRYSNFANTKGRRLFNKIMSAESVVFMQVVTISLGLPAVAGIADFCFDFVNRSEEIEWTIYTKQFVGAAVGYLMQVNGFRKVGRRSVPQKCFKKSAVYRKVGRSNAVG